MSLLAKHILIHPQGRTHVERAIATHNYSVMLEDEWSKRENVWWTDKKSNQGNTNFLCKPLSILSKHMNEW